MEHNNNTLEKDVRDVVCQVFGKTKQMRNFSRTEMNDILLGMSTDSTLKIIEQIYHLTETARKEDWPRDELIGQMHLIIYHSWNALRSSPYYSRLTKTLDLEDMVEGLKKNLYKV